MFNAYNLQFIQILHVASEVEMFVGSGFSINTNVNDIKLQMWKHFVDDCAEHGRVTFY